MINQDDIKKMKSERNIIFTALLFASAMLLITALLVWNGQITGYHSLQTFETESTVTGSSHDNNLRFNQIPNFMAEVGDHIKFKVNPNTDAAVFSDDTNMFNITTEGIVEFIPSPNDVGEHNVWIIIKNNAGQHYYQNVLIIIEEESK